MAYDFNLSQQQLSDLIRQYQQLQNIQPQQNIPQNFVIPQTVPIPVPSHQVQYVEGIEGARKYQLERLQPNSSEVIMDKDDNIFYMVSKDANGTPSKKIPIARFQLEEPPEAMMAIYEYLHKKFIRKAKEIKIIQSMYNE